MSKAQRVGYIRVSSVDQNTDRQLDGITLDKTYTDRASGKDAKRPQLTACMEFVREGDTLVVHSMDRLARNLLDLQRIVQDLTSRGVSVEFVKEAQTFKHHEHDGMQTLMMQILGAVAEFERAMIRERQREGIAIAKRDTPEKYASLFERRVERGQCFSRPYLGCREFAADFTTIDPAEQSVSDTMDLGLMLYDIIFAGDAKKGGNEAVFFQARIERGVMVTDPLIVLPDEGQRERVLSC